MSKYEDILERLIAWSNKWAVLDRQMVQPRKELELIIEAAKQALGE